MNPSIDNPQTRNPDDDRLIDRLIDGELPGVARQELLLSLENQPDGWRRCALAFLEAQLWRQALAPEASPPATVPPPVPTTGRRSRLWRPMARMTALAASLAAAFALGWTYHPGPNLVDHVGFDQKHDEVVDGPVRVADAPVGPRQRMEDPKADLAKVLGSTNVTRVSLDSIVKRWQQEGYRVETQPCLVSVQAKDGRKMNVPVQEVRVRYVGDRIY